MGNRLYEKMAGINSSWAILFGSLAQVEEG